MIASGLAPLTSSGSISGTGLASARINGSGASATAIPASARAALRGPRKISAPPITSPRVRALVSSRNDRSASGPFSCGPTRPRLRSVTMMFCGSAPMVTSKSRQAIAAAPAPEVTSFTSSIRLPSRRRPLQDRGAHDDRRAVLIVMKDRNLQAARADFCSISKHSGALISSRLMPPKVGSRRRRPR